MTEFDEFFGKATGCEPYPFQRRFATDPEMPAVVSVPTGLGKTAMAILGWLWRRRFASGDARRRTPRRLVYCLPMRVLVEQTRDVAVTWLHNVRLLAGTAKFDEHDGKKNLKSYTIDFNVPEKIAVHVLMGGEDEDDWDIHPEREAIIIGTQDMLLSRALNRGYAASRSRWPMQFGLLHTDCLWVFDEIQLMGAGLATTAQMEAFRHLLPNGGSYLAKSGHECRSVWMSATLQRDWLKTVDFAARVDGLPSLGLTDEDHAHGQVKQRWEARKAPSRVAATMGEAEKIAKEVSDAHKPGTRTIVVVNTVRRACELFKALEIACGEGLKRGSKRKKARDLQENVVATTVHRRVLLHSRFRPGDRKKAVDQALAEPPPEGTIVVSTQVIEAGVDVSATTLFTELAPWASLVQRFGRCNRKGAESGAQVLWMGLPTEKANAEMLAPPYPVRDLEASMERLKELKDVGLKSLPLVELDFEHIHVIRRKDLIDLFDTTPDLAGNDIDIDRFVREVEDSDVRVFWRDYVDTPNGTEDREVEPAPRREEICPVPIGSDKRPGFRQFVKNHRGKVWRWNFLEKKWEKADAGRIVPGQVFLLRADAGGYSPESGWDINSEDRVEPVNQPEDKKGEAPDAIDDERLSRIGIWQTVSEHTEDACREMDHILAALSTTTDDESDTLRRAARWHDRGKVHKVFQNAIDDGQTVKRRGKMLKRRERPEKWRKRSHVAKAPGKIWKDRKLIDPGFWRSYDWLPEEGRRYFRHELASALAVLLAPEGLVPSAHRDLVAYLVAAHHGKVRLSIRSLPNETRPDGGRRFARGVWDGDELDQTDLGGGQTVRAVRLSLEPMELGLCEQEPFVGQPSWAERMIRLRDEIGPFRLAYLEAVLRAADMRASKADEQRGKEAAAVLSDGRLSAGRHGK